jgi:hypothetical protein
MSILINSLNRAFCRAFQALHTIVVQAIGVYVFRPHPVRLQPQVNNEAAAAVRSALFGDEEVVHAKCPQACRVGYMPV